MKIELIQEQPHKLVEQIAKSMKAKVGVDCHEWGMRIPAKIGKGCITGYSFNDGLGLLLMDGTFKEDIEIVIKSKKPAPLILAFCKNGELTHQFNDSHINYKLNPLLGSIAANPAKKSQFLKFPAGVETLITMLLIDRAAYQKKMSCELGLMPDELKDTFEDVKATAPFLYQSNYSIAISECITSILNTDSEGLVRTTFIESKILELLSLQIKQYEDDLKAEGKQTLLREYEVEKIKLAREILVSDLKQTITIPMLVRKVGINQQKLKLGFKQIFKQTIRQYLRSEKCEKAKLLLLEGTMSISDIATHVGYSNKSHFSDAFRKKFGLLPRDFLKQFKENDVD